MTRFFVRFLSLLVLLASLRCFALEKQPVAEYHARRVALSLDFIADLPHTAEDVEAAMSAPAKSTGKRR